MQLKFQVPWFLDFKPQMKFRFFFQNTLLEYMLRIDFSISAERNLSEKYLWVKITSVLQLLVEVWVS